MGQEYASGPSVDVLTDVMDRTGLEAVSQGGGEIGQPENAINVGLGTDLDAGGERGKQSIYHSLCGDGVR